MERWSKSILSVIQPMAFASVVGRAKRSQLISWAEILETVAREMRSKAGG